MLKMYNYSDESITMPLTMSLATFNRGRRVPITNIMAGGGVLSGEEKLEVKNFSISGSVYYQNYADMRAFYDALLVFLEDSPIRIYQDETDSRFIYARCTNVKDTWLDGRAELELNLDFVASDPYFYSIEHVDTQSFTSSPKTFSIHVGGNVVSYPTILVNKNSGTIENLEIKNNKNNKKIVFSGDITKSIMINNKDLMVTSNTDSLLASVDTGWLINSLTVEPGENEFTVTGSGTFDYTIITKWRSKWL
jgi:hypothetical protein